MNLPIAFLRNLESALRFELPHALLKMKSVPWKRLEAIDFIACFSSLDKSLSQSSRAMGGNNGKLLSQALVAE